MKKPTFKILHCGNYPFDVLFTIGSTKEEIMKYLKRTVKYELDKEEKEALDVEGKSGRTVQLKNNAFVLWVYNDSFPVIAHEIFHVAELMMEHIKTPLNESTSEPYAYLIESLTRQVLRK